MCHECLSWIGIELPDLGSSASMRCVDRSLSQPSHHGFMTNNRLSLLLAALLLPFVLVGCDAAGGDTATLNATSPIPPTVEYEFEYDSNNQVSGEDLVEVTSTSADNLGNVLDENGGFSRSSVVSATVDSVKFIQSSPKRGQQPAPKFIFDNLLRATVFLGTSDSGVQIADDTFDPNDDADKVPLTVTTSDVTSTVKNGSTKAFLRLETDGDITRTDRVRVKVFYEITVSGV